MNSIKNIWGFLEENRKKNWRIIRREMDKVVKTNPIQMVTWTYFLNSLLYQN